MHDLALGDKAVLNSPLRELGYQRRGPVLLATDHLNHKNTHFSNTFPYDYARARETTSLSCHTAAIHIQTPNHSQQRALSDDYRQSEYVWKIV